MPEIGTEDNRIHRKVPEASGLQKFLENLRLSYRSGSGGGFGYDGSVIKQGRMEKEARLQEEIARKEAEDEAKREAYQKKLDAYNRMRELKRRTDLAGNLASGNIPLYDYNSVGKEESARPEGMGEGPMPSASESELRGRRFQTELGLGNSPEQAMLSTQRAFEPPKPVAPSKPTQAEIKESLFNEWENVKEQFNGDEKAAWDAIPASAKRSLRFHNIYDPGKRQQDLESDLKKAVTVERRKRAAEYDKIMSTLGDPRRAEVSKMTKAEYIAQADELGVINDPVYAGQFDDLKSKYEQDYDQKYGGGALGKVYGATDAQAAAAAPAQAPAAAQSQEQVIQQLQQFLESETQQTNEMRQRIERLMEILGVKK